MYNIGNYIWTDFHTRKHITHVTMIKFLLNFSLDKPSLSIQPQPGGCPIDSIMGLRHLESYEFVRFRTVTQTHACMAQLVIADALGHATRPLP